jgi:hypothetical protein
MAAEEEEKRVETSGSDKQMHPFDRLMFGSNSKTSRLTDDEKLDLDTESSNQVNLEELMVQIGTLMDSAKHLKPMFHKIRPLIEQFLKK